jgi:hypothetical protein
LIIIEVDDAAGLQQSAEVDEIEEGTIETAVPWTKPSSNARRRGSSADNSSRVESLT